MAKIERNRALRQGRNLLQKGGTLIGIRNLSLIMISIALSFVASASGNPNVFIGINGGENEYSNFHYFENDLAAFASAMSFDGFQTKILNGGGPDGHKIQIVNDSSERDVDGHIILTKNRLNGESADIDNINQVLKVTKAENPKSVVFLFVDHGSEKGMATWKGPDFTNKEFREIDKYFAPETLERRIHLYCFSGRALAPLEPLTSSAGILKSFPANRCGLSSADTDELSQSSDTFNGFIQKGDPSLKEMKSFLMNDRQLSSSPRLTSDYFKEAVLQLTCGQSQEEKLCPNTSLNGDTKQMLCKLYSSGQSQLEGLSENVSKAVKKYIDLESAESQLFIRFFIQKYPEQQKLLLSFFDKRESNEILFDERQKITPEERKAFDFYRERSAGVQEHFGSTTGLNWLKKIYKTKSLDDKIRDPDDRDFQYFLLSDKTQSERKFSIGEQTYSASELPKLEKKVIENIESAGEQRKKLRAQLDNARDDLVNLVLENTSDPSLKDRLKNLKKCEALPLKGS